MWMVPKTNGYWQASILQKLRNIAAQKNVTEGTVQTFFRSTSTWELYHKARLINRKQSVLSGLS